LSDHRPFRHLRLDEGGEISRVSPTAGRKGGETFLYLGLREQRRISAFNRSRMGSGVLAAPQYRSSRPPRSPEALLRDRRHLRQERRALEGRDAERPQLPRFDLRRDSGMASNITGICRP